MSKDGQEEKKKKKDKGKEGKGKVRELLFILAE